jgi:hypothetical protein
VKTCRDCTTSKPGAAFGADVRNRDGLKGVCKECENLRVAAWRRANEGGKYTSHKEASRIRAAEYYSENRKEIRAKAIERSSLIEVKQRKAAADKAYQMANADRLRKLATERRHANPELWNRFNRERSKKPENAARKAADVAWRRAALRRATPSWVNRDELVQIYRSAKEAQRNTGKKMHVDHIVPLVSPIVCGLHVPWNLQVLFYKDNHSKSNKHWPDMPESTGTASR